ncbi:hypothetical protein TL16_g04505 [Triparma laevis f. inornata]|uniref:EamA domain-containing protein n=1 Tax=Triparma laevis f. inornata TaxID=1714386 RepID=A0A9W7A6Y0_9STRA|nr:hypothetical protein TL16_g04505 [Triparma laevis f. inornata]
MDKDDAPLLSPTDDSPSYAPDDLIETIYYSSSEEENDDDVSFIPYNVSSTDVSSTPLLTETRARRISSTTQALRRQKKNSKLGILSLAMAVLIASSKDAVFKRIFTKSSTKSGYFNACNVLCGSNLIGLFTLPLLFKKDLTFIKVKAIKKRQWAIMFFGTSLYSVLGPMLYLMGLQTSSVIDAAILSRLESLEFLLLATCIIPNSPLDLWSSLNAFLILCGVCTSIITKPCFDESDSYLDVDSGAAYIIAGGSCFVVSLLLTKRFLSDVPVGILGMFRVFMGTAVYHTQAMIRNDENNAGYLNVELWKNLWWFALIYVTLFQAVWLFALQNAKSVHISVGTTGIFLLSLMWAYTIVQGTALTGPQIISVGVIMFGVVSGIVRGIRGGRKGAEEKTARLKMKDDLVRDSEVGTRGVI